MYMYIYVYIYTRCGGLCFWAQNVTCQEQQNKKGEATQRVGAQQRRTFGGSRSVLSGLAKVINPPE